MAISGILGDLAASAREAKCCVHAIARSLGNRCLQISFCCAFVVGAVEMLCAEGLVALAVPFRRTHMQVAPAGSQQG